MADFNFNPINMILSGLINFPKTTEVITPVPQNKYCTYRMNVPS